MQNGDIAFLTRNFAQMQTNKPLDFSDFQSLVSKCLLALCAVDQGNQGPKAGSLLNRVAMPPFLMPDCLASLWKPSFS